MTNLHEPNDVWTLEEDDETRQYNAEAEMRTAEGLQRLRPEVRAGMIAAMERGEALKR
jgi:hypothetical protein